MTNTNKLMFDALKTVPSRSLVVWLESLSPEERRRLKARIIEINDIIDTIDYKSRHES